MKKTELNPSFEIPFNHLTLGDELGDGGFGMVYKATYLKADSAVKKLKASTLTPQVKEEFLKETSIMAQLHHPNVIQLYGVCVQPYAIVMEYMPKGSLFTFIHNPEEISWAKRYSIGIDIGKGIHFLHSKGIIHRDLKSLNVLLNNQYQAKLCDFGLAKIKVESNTTTHAKGKQELGTVRWKAPELFKRGSMANQASDVYAYGMVLWEMAARQIPYQEERDNAMVASWIKDGEQEKIPDSTPSPYTEVIQAAWLLDASQRPDALTLLEKLEQGQQLLMEDEKPAKIPADDAATLQFSSDQRYLSSEYTSTLSNQSTDILVNPGKQEDVTASGPTYFSSINQLEGLSISNAVTTKTNQITSPSISNLSPASYQDTPEDLVKAARTMLQAREWKAEQKAFFEKLMELLPLPPLQTFKGHTDKVNALVLLPNGQQIASCSDDTTIKLWDLESGKSLLSLQHSSSAKALALLPDNQLAGGYSDKTIKVWDLNSGKCLNTLTEHQGSVEALAGLPNGQLVSGSSDQTIKVWDLSNGKCLTNLTGHDKKIKILLPLPNDQLASGSDDYTIKLWDLKNGKSLMTLRGHAEPVNTLVLLPDGQLASGSEDGAIKLWDLKSGQYLKTITGHVGGITKLCLLGNTHLISCGKDKAIRCWRLDSWQCEYTYFSLTDGSSIDDLLSVSTTACVASSGRNLQQFSFVPLQLLRQSLSQSVSQPQALTTGHYNFFKSNAPRLLERLPKTMTGHTHGVNTLALLPNGQLVSGAEDGTIKLWNLQNGQCLTTLGEHNSSVKALWLLPNGQLASGSEDKTIKIWDLSSGQCLKTLKGHTYRVNALVALSKDQLASGSYDDTIKIWDLNSGQCLKTLKGHTSTVAALTSLPNGLLASGSADHTIKLWNAKAKFLEKDCQNTLKGHTSSVNTLLLLPNGQLASGSSDSTIKVWDYTSGQCLRTLKGHTGYVNALVLLPNGQLVSGSNDNTIKLWDPTSGQCLTTLKGHNARVSALVPLPNGQLVSGSSDNTIKIWDPNFTQTLEELEQKAPECKTM